MPIVSLFFFAGAVVLTRNRRKGLVRATTGLAISMALILVLYRVVLNHYIAGVHSPQSPEAQTALLDTVTAALRDTVWIILIVAALIAIGAVVAGNARVRHKVSDISWMTKGPVHDFVALHRRALQWSVLVLGLLILVLWSNPTTLVAVVIVLITLAIVGLVGLFAGRGPRSAVASSAGTIANQPEKTTTEK